MGIGPQIGQTQLNAKLAAVAQQWQDAATASQRLFSDLNGLGGTTWLEGPQPGYDSTDATAIMALAGQFNQCAGLLAGTGTLSAAFNFLGSFAVVLDPTASVSG